MPNDQFDNFDLDSATSGEYINQPGEYDVQIMEAKPHYAKSGTAGVRYLVMTQNRSKTSLDFWLTDAAKPRLRSFAIACGLTPEQMKDFNPSDLVDYQVRITFEAQEGTTYLDAKTWKECDNFELDPEVNSSDFPL
jgi:hypothetical protein